MFCRACGRRAGRSSLRGRRAAPGRSVADRISIAARWQPRSRNAFRRPSAPRRPDCHHCCVPDGEIAVRPIRRSRRPQLPESCRVANYPAGLCDAAEGRGRVRRPGRRVAHAVVAPAAVRGGAIQLSLMAMRRNRVREYPLQFVPAQRVSAPTSSIGLMRPRSRVGSTRWPRSRPPSQPPLRNLMPCTTSPPSARALTSACLTFVPPPDAAVQAREVPCLAHGQAERLHASIANERAQATPTSQSQSGAAVALAQRDGRGAVPFSASSRR